MLLIGFGTRIFSSVGGVHLHHCNEPNTETPTGVISARGDRGGTMIVQFKGDVELPLTRAVPSL